MTNILTDILTLCEIDAELVASLSSNLISWGKGGRHILLGDIPILYEMHRIYLCMYSCGGNCLGRRGGEILKFPPPPPISPFLCIISNPDSDVKGLEVTLSHSC